ncbi:YtxH domain-containing protein [uncultured Fusobacterium sp.]|uniref:YtxH domain-containing protein n=1 Tax=uncultured Fusobacterium sp. TaxID=159267 RepID=UPI00262420DD|nr:YtxH domain-containing protein [uncultured Fusobacterium sp.]
MGLINYIHEKRLERERAIRNEKILGTLKVLAGVGAGFTLGILFAPKSGKETRKDISKAAKEGLNYVGENLTNAKNYIQEKTSNIKEALAERYDELRTEVIPEKIDEFEEEVGDTTEKIEENFKK